MEFNCFAHFIRFGGWVGLVVVAGCCLSICIAVENVVVGIGNVVGVVMVVALSVATVVVVFALVGGCSRRYARPSVRNCSSSPAQPSK